jgi:putative transposase
MSAPDRRQLVDRKQCGLSVRRQCELLAIARSGVYRPPPAANDNDLALMRRIDELFTGWPFLGSRRMTAMLRAEGYAVNRKRVRRLMRKMGIAALGPKPHTSKPAPGHKIFPYLLRGLAIERANQVWCADITYIPIGRGFLYLVAIMDWASRAVLAWRLSNTMETSFCVSALEEALARFGRPEIFNTDQGSQFTSAAFTGVLMAAGVRISMDGRGRWMDNVFIEGHLLEGLCRRPRGEQRHRRAVCVYNTRRPHQTLGDRTPMAVWREGTTGPLGNKAVDMMDNARALPTCPQRQQQAFAMVG